MFAPLLDLLFPPACAACNAVLAEGERGPFCPTCSVSLEPLGERVCQRCGEPGLHPAGTCMRCVLEPPPFLRAFAPFAHTGALARAIHRFKYEDHPELAAPLGTLLTQSTAVLVESIRGRPVVPLPLHGVRFRRRGYDQAALLADEVARRLGQPASHQALLRARATQRQVGLTEAEREQNVEGAFVAAASHVRGGHFLLVDDVLTTGATARAATRALMEAGARSVFVLALARAFSES